MAFDNDELNKRRQRRAELRQQRKAQQKKLTIGLIAAGVVLVLCAALILVLALGNRSSSSETQPPETTETPVTTEGATLSQTQPSTEETLLSTEPPASNVVRLAVAGDLVVTDKTVTAGVSGTGYDYSRVFMDVLPLLTDADLTLMNFEGNFCGAPYGSQTVSAPEEMLDALVRAGVDMLQMANSCTINNGLLGLSETLDTIRSAGIDPIGAFSSPAEFRETGGYTIREVNGIKIAFIAFTKGMDNLGLPSGSEDCVNLLYQDYDSTYQKVDTDRINKILRNAASEKPDITIALLHWGSEYNDQISSTQKTILNLMLDGGVDVVLGTHSHYVQQMIHDPVNNTFVAYSLGDFYSDAETAGSNYSVVLELEFTKDGATGVTTITNYSYTPIFTHTAISGHRVVRIHSAIEAYENNNIDHISAADYESMVYALKRIEERIKGE